MRAAVYCRRSKEEHQIESLGVQTEGAERFIESNGWTLVLKIIEGEDGSDTSRAEFKKRPKLIAMLNAATRIRPMTTGLVPFRADSSCGTSWNFI